MLGDPLGLIYVQIIVIGTKLDMTMLKKME